MVRHTEDRHRLRYPQGMGRPTKSVLLFSVVLAASPACKRQTSPGADVDLAGMDKSVAPGDDFNAYTNGGWIKATPIPADKSSYGTGAILVDETRKRLLALIQEVGQGANRGNRRRPEDRRLLLELHGRSGHRVQGNRAAEAATRRDRGHRGSPCARPRPGQASCAPMSIR